MSKFTKTPIVDASDDELRDFCELQQLDVSEAKSRADLLGTLGPAWEHDYIMTVAPVEMDEDEAAAMAEQTQSPVISGQSLAGGAGANDPKFVVQIGNAAGPGGNQPVPIGCNGKTMVAQRNMKVELPARFFFVLEKAIREEVTQNERTGEIDTMEFTSYPMQVFQRPTDAELAEWRERTDNELLPA